jgi:hypothetical protein
MPWIFSGEMGKNILYCFLSGRGFFIFCNGKLFVKVCRAPDDIPTV